MRDILNGFREVARTERATLWRDYRAVLDRRRAPSDGDAAELVRLARLLGLTEADAREHVNALDRHEREAKISAGADAAAVAAREAEAAAGAARTEAAAAAEAARRKVRDSEARFISAQAAASRALGAVHAIGEIESRFPELFSREPEAVAPRADYRQLRQAALAGDGADAMDDSTGDELLAGRMLRLRRRELQQAGLTPTEVARALDREADAIEQAARQAH